MAFFEVSSRKYWVYLLTLQFLFCHYYISCSDLSVKFIDLSKIKFIHNGIVNINDINVASTILLTSSSNMFLNWDIREGHILFSPYNSVSLPISSLHCYGYYHVEHTLMYISIHLKHRYYVHWSIECPQFD